MSEERTLHEMCDEASRHYHEHGYWRAVDVYKILGDPRIGIGVGPDGPYTTINGIIQPKDATQ